MRSRRKFHFVDRLDHLSYPTIFLLWTANVCVFAAIYVVLSVVPGQGPIAFEGQDLLARILNSVYYSVITATNTGYGDIVPQGLSRLFAATEAFSGLFLFALFMAKLVSRKQDVAISHMHRLSFEGTFHDIREDLHVVRGDFDSIIHIVRSGATIMDREWELLRVAYQQIAGLLREIPHFYDYENNLYRIDPRRETLLIEALHRTFHRIDNLLTLLTERDIEWIAHEDSVTQLRDLLQVFDATLVQWKREASHGSSHMLQELAHVSDSIRSRLAEAYPIA